MIIFGAFLSFEYESLAKFSDTRRRRSQITMFNVGLRALAVKGDARAAENPGAADFLNVSFYRITLSPIDHKISCSC